METVLRLSASLYQESIMSQHTELQTTTDSTTSPQELRAEALARVAKEVCDDSQKSPDAYLTETEVPHGGE